MFKDGLELRSSPSKAIGWGLLMLIEQCIRHDWRRVVWTGQRGSKCALWVCVSIPPISRPTPFKIWISLWQWTSRKGQPYWKPSEACMHANLHFGFVRMQSKSWSDHGPKWLFVRIMNDSDDDNSNERLQEGEETTTTTTTTINLFEWPQDVCNSRVMALGVKWNVNKLPKN